jgi:hypothetical protein
VRRSSALQHPECCKHQYHISKVQCHAGAGHS